MENEPHRFCTPIVVEIPAISEPLTPDTFGIFPRDVEDDPLSPGVDSDGSGDIGV